MAVCASGDVIRVTAKMSYSSGSAQVQNVYHLLCQFSGDQDDQDVHDAIAAKMEDAYAEITDMIPNEIAFDTIATWNLTQDRPMIEDTWPTFDVGQCSGSDNPGAQLSPLVLFDTDVARSQGRKYLPPPCSGNNLTVMGALQAGTKAEMLAYAAELLASIVISAGNELIFGNYAPGLARFAPWVAAKVDSWARTQRRRVSGVGS